MQLIDAHFGGRFYFPTFIFADRIVTLATVLPLSCFARRGAVSRRREV